MSVRQSHFRALTAFAVWFIATGVPAATTPCAIDTRSVQIGGGTVPYNVAGTGPTTLLLHGLFAEKEQ